MSKMLCFNSSSENGSSQWQEVWKILIYDKYCGDIISLLLKKGELRNLGITLNLYVQLLRHFIQNFIVLNPQFLISSLWGYLQIDIIIRFFNPIPELVYLIPFIDSFIRIGKPLLTYLRFILFLQIRITLGASVRYP